jgi:hypothetical protein
VVEVQEEQVLELLQVERLVHKVHQRKQVLAVEVEVPV